MHDSLVINPSVQGCGIDCVQGRHDEQRSGDDQGNGEKRFTHLRSLLVKSPRQNAGLRRIALPFSIGHVY
jgi:hypothetical protein